jgi:hypothetical protein
MELFAAEGHVPPKSFELLTQNQLKHHEAPPLGAAAFAYASILDRLQ